MGLRPKRASWALALFAMLALTGCSLFEQKAEPPPRADDPIEVPGGQSTLATDIEIGLGTMRRALEAEIPTRLWSIDQPDAECVPPQRTEVIGITLKSPTIRCDLNGRVTRGRLRLSGRGQDLIVTMPISAELVASDIAGIVGRKTATANATVTARVRLSIRKDWSIRGRVDIDYGWRKPPTVTLLGQDVTFASEADERLKKVVATLERTLEREIARLDLHSQIEPLWERGFTVLPLNERNPPVWMRLTPQALGYDGYSATRDTLSVAMRLDARTEVFVGDKPPVPVVEALPEMMDRSASEAQLALTLPVVAQYAQLEPVIERALTKRAERPFSVPAIGDRMIELRSVTAYGTTGNRIAVGVEFKAWRPNERDDPASGTVWITARPVNEPNSRTIDFVEPEYSIETTRFTTNVLLEIAKTQDFSDAIEDALTQNFEDDFARLLGKVDRAVAQKQIGEFSIATDIDKISTGTLTAYGEGLFLPVTAKGETQIRYLPR